MWLIWSKRVACRKITFFGKQRNTIKGNFFNFEILLEIGTEICISDIIHLKKFIVLVFICRILAATVGSEPATLRMQGSELTTKPPHS